MDHGDAMTDVPPKTRRMPPPENAVQWGILVFWAVVIVIWTWYLSLFAAWATQEGSLDAITLWLLALAPPVVAAWRYPTGRIFRSVFAAVALAIPVACVILIAIEWLNE